MAFKIAVSNNKGGVAKSTTAANLAARLAQLGHRVLVVDADPSAGLTAFLGKAAEVLAEPPAFKTLADALERSEFVPCKDIIAGLDLLPATSRLAFVAEERLAQKDGYLLLDAFLRMVEADYDYIIVDTQPTLSTLQVMALIAAPNLIIPVQTDVGNVPMMINFHTSIRRLKETAQPSLRILGVLPTFYSRSANMPEKMVNNLAAEFGSERIFATRISRRQSIADAAEFGQPIIVSKPSDPGAQEYANFTMEVVRRAEDFSS